MMKPPAIKQTVAISEGNCKEDKPMIACPLVHPPAYLVPNPTKNPPITIKENPLMVNREDQLNKEVGNNDSEVVMPYDCNSDTNLGLISTGWWLVNKYAAIKPPRMMPEAKNRFHISFFQSYLKKEMFAGIQAAHT